MGPRYYATLKENTFAEVQLMYDSGSGNRKRGYYARFDVVEVYKGECGSLISVSPADGFTVRLMEVSRRSKSSEAKARAWLEANLQRGLAMLEEKNNLRVLQAEPVDIS